MPSPPITSESAPVAVETPLMSATDTDEPPLIGSARNTRTLTMTRFAALNGAGSWRFIGVAGIARANRRACGIDDVQSTGVRIARVPIEATDAVEENVRIVVRHDVVAACDVQSVILVAGDTNRSTCRRAR